MRIGLRYHHVLMGALGVAACAAGAARSAAPAAPAAPNSKAVEFDSADGVHLEGNLWSNAGSAKKRDATVLLLHDFNEKTGGSSRDPGWDDLGEKLLAEGYSVFSFDFRGFGESKKVDPEKFWDLRKNPQNQMVKGANRRPLPEEIDHAGFQSNYYPQLANDVEAAKAFLDRRNDAGEVNTSSLFVIGAGQGATVGALWMASQWRLRKGDLGPLGTLVIDPKTGRPSLQDAEGKDQAGAIWLDISPTLGGRNLSSSLRSWVGEVGGANRVPMVFLYGGKDKEGKEVAAECLRAVLTGYREGTGGSIPQAEVTAKMDEKKREGEWKLPDTIKHSVGGDVTLTGSKLLTNDLDTVKDMVGLLNHVMGDRKNLESRKRDTTTAAFFWRFGGEGTLPIRAKEPMEKTMPLIPVARFVR